MRHVFQVALTSLFFTVLTWKWFSWKGIVSFIPLWTGFEVFYRSKVRAVLSCPHCGFDPYLYLSDVKRARQEIETHWRKKFAENGMPDPYQDKGSSSPPPARRDEESPAISLTEPERER